MLLRLVRLHCYETQTVFEVTHSVAPVPGEICDTSDDNVLITKGCAVANARPFQLIQSILHLHSLDSNMRPSTEPGTEFPVLKRFLIVLIVKLYSVSFSLLTGYGQVLVPRFCVAIGKCAAALSEDSQLARPGQARRPSSG